MVAGVAGGSEYVKRHCCDYQLHMVGASPHSITLDEYIDRGATCAAVAGQQRGSSKGQQQDRRQRIVSTCNATSGNRCRPVLSVGGVVGPVGPIFEFSWFARRRGRGVTYGMRLAPECGESVMGGHGRRRPSIVGVGGRKCIAGVRSAA